MAYINISEWSSDLVCCWLKGLDDSMYKYISFFANNGVGGQQLLNIRPYELEQLGMYSIGDQEIVLEAVENLRNFHYNLDKENLQFLALQVASASKNLYRQLNNHCDKTKLKTQILSDITRTIATIKPLISWLDRVPFQGQLQFNEIRRNMSRLGLEMATIAQRDRFVENPVDQIRVTADRLTKLADYIIQDITDPMLIQPASLNLVTVKKRENDVGFSIEPSFHGIHRITEIKYNSPAHNSGKIENGDEIVQINYQTVVGWQYKTVIMQLRESTPDVLLTLKKRPKHTKIYGQIYMQPYRLPSKKRVLTTRWSDNLPSPRVADFLTVPDFNLPLKITEEKNSQQNNLSDTDSSCSDILTPTDSKSVGDKEIRLYYPKPRAVLQRRNTICGDDLASLKNVGSIPLWHERSNRKAYHYHHQNGDPSSPSLRDKSVSFGYGLECTRPTTCLGITTTATSSNNTTNAGGKFNDLISLLPEKLYTENNGKLIKTKQDKDIEKIDDEQNKLSNNNNNSNKLNDEKSKPGVCKVVRFDANMKYDDYPIDNKYMCNVENTILETFEPIPYVDDDIDDIDEMNPEINSNDSETSPEIDTPKIPINTLSSSSNNNNNNNNIRIFTFEQNKCDNELCQAINTVVLNRRGRLDKSHSTPAYDNSGEEESDTPPPLPPAIEPRKEFLISPSPPPPPPRPKKLSSEIQIVPIPPPKPLFLSQKNQQQQQSIINNINTGQQYISRQENLSNLSTPPPIPLHTTNNDHHNTAEQQLELMTPLKTKTLTLKKKNSLMAKRRKITLKILGTGDIQGHLYRRTKDKRGVTFWAKLYFVLIETVLYGFRTKYANKANCMVVLPGFTVSLAKEVHSKPFAFKVYHTSKTFYFAAESSEALQQWMDFINQATMKNNNNSSQQNNDIIKKQQILDKDLFSETDSSGDEFNDLLPKQLCTPSPVSSSSSVRDFLQHQKNHLTSIPDTTPIKSDNKYLGSLKKLTKLKSNNSNNNNNSNNTINNQHNQIGSSGNNDNNNRKNSSDIPMPTAQFRCYRKVPGGSFGLQIGTQTSPYHDNNYSPQSQNLLSPPPQPPPDHKNQQQQKFFPDQQPPPPPLRKPSISSIQSTVTTNTELNNSSPLNTPNLIIENEYQNRYELTVTDIDNAGKLKLKRTSPFNFIHASNPNLVEFDFQTSKTLDHSMPKINIVGNSTCWDTVPPNNSLQGFVTLKDLMLQKQEEDAQEMYNNRVLLGVEKKDKMNRNNRNGCHNGNINKNNNNSGSNNNINDNTKIKSKIQMRSLPKTPDYEMSFKPDDEDIKRTRSKAGLKLRDFGYEFISGDDVSTVIGGDTQTKSNNNINKTLQNYQSQLQTITQTNKKSMTTSSGAGEIQEKSSRGGSFKKTKGKFEAFKTSSEKIFQFKHHHHKDNTNNNTNDDLKSLKSISTTTYAPMTLPLNKKSQSQLYNMQQVDQQQHSISQCNIKKSQTYNSEFKDNNNKLKSDDKTLRKNSAPMPILSKFSFSSSGSGKSVKEKKLLGSPRLHRAIFGRSSSNRIDQDYDHEIFCPITFVKHPQAFSSETSSSSTSSPFDTQSITSTNSLPIVQQQPPTPIKTTNQTPEYPNMECPPVFEAETYSLSDPNASLTLLRRRNNNLEEDHNP